MGRNINEQEQGFSFEPRRIEARKAHYNIYYKNSVAVIEIIYKGITKNFRNVSEIDVQDYNMDFELRDLQELIDKRIIVNNEPLTKVLIDEIRLEYFLTRH